MFRDFCLSSEENGGSGSRYNHKCFCFFHLLLSLKCYSIMLSEFKNEWSIVKSINVKKIRENYIKVEGRNLYILHYWILILYIEFKETVSEISRWQSRFTTVPLKLSDFIMFQFFLDLDVLNSDNSYIFSCSRNRQVMCVVTTVFEIIISNLYQIRQSFLGYRCESDLAIFTHGGSLKVMLTFSWFAVGTMV